MTQYYFSDPEKQKQLKIILDSWLGTKYRHHTGVKNLGADCIHFVAKVYEEMGLLIWKKGLIPDYCRDWHLNNSRELLSEGIEKMDHGVKVEKVSVDSPMNGDIILSHYGKAASHAAIFCDDHIYQSIIEMGVCKISFTDRLFRKQMKFAYRIL